MNAIHNTVYAGNTALLHQLFEKQVERTPENIALEMGEASLTFSALNRKANQLARHLIQRGVTSETVIGIHLERSIEQVIALLGVLKAGGAFLPLDVQQPVVRLEAMMRQAKSQWLITHNERADNFRQTVRHKVLMDQMDNWAGEYSSSNPDLKMCSANLAYVMFTSGSTGTPKGVMVEHHSVVNYLKFLVDNYQFDDRTVVLQIASFGFDACLRDFFVPLATGGRLVLLSQREARMPREILWRINNHQVNTVLSVVPTMMRLLLDEMTTSGLAVKSLENLFISGETLTQSDCQRMRELFGPSLRIVNQYGPTEATMIAMNYVVPTGKIPQRISVGKPVSGVQCYLLNDSLKPVPVGEEGEIYIAGAGVSRGYISQPGLTAQAFLPDPFMKNPGSRIYRTGDYAWMNAKGEFHFVGRKDWQVKINGNRVELGEIEVVLQSHKNIQQAVVKLFEEDNAAALVAYLTPTPGSYLDDAMVRSYLTAKLPTYMLPQEIVILERLPRTLSGKVDRQALQLPPRLKAFDLQEYVPPRNELEKRMISVWERVLKVKRIGVTDNFFSLGGHSLLAVQLAGEIQKAVGVNLPVYLIFANPTVESLVLALESASKDN